MTAKRHQVKVLLDERQLRVLDDWRRRLVVEYGAFISRPEALRVMLDDAASVETGRTGRPVGAHAGKRGAP